MTAPKALPELPSFGPLTEFDYLLNRFELASQSDEPAANGYRTHRAALYAYVRSLEAYGDARAQAARMEAMAEALKVCESERDELLSIADMDKTMRLLDQAEAVNSLAKKISALGGKGEA